MTKAMDFGKKNGYVSLSTLQRHLRIGFTTAARLIDRMVADGFCSAEYSENGQRKVLASSSRYQDDAR
jgi:DNA segregation ATPase FtsK/SpoIIIE-like protein